jgi:hypothetical protein
LEPVQDPLGSDDRLRILAMRQIMPWATIAEPQRLHGPMDGIDTGLHPALALEQRLQIANTPDRDRHVIRLRPLLERRLQERPIGGAQGMWAPTTRAIYQPCAPFGGKAL